MFRVGTKIQSTLTTAVYNKTLKLSNSSRRQKTQGEIVNLMAIDVDRFRLITPQLQQYWSSPMQVSFYSILGLVFCSLYVATEFIRKEISESLGFR
ncbi:hypothetical protein ANCDUO_21098 [Ancylostoma duodenale]|uniref:ABC transmembrane type-1 domain-containing protein n=1 Tax=Ancylostoma duodenale TaxID=51022 RepID=A0A0C2FQ57_9BILA|nr:hypothetical protein ANCDUO_21098 [Ancylostoma duodenale]